MGSRKSCSDCGHNECLAEYVDHDYCFSCHKTSFLDTKRTIVSRPKKVFEGVPEEACCELPSAAWAYLWQYGITQEAAAKRDLRYIDFIEIDGVKLRNRLLIPGIVGGECQYVLLRALTKGDVPKVYNWGNMQNLYYANTYNFTDYVVIVEDAISAIVVGEVNRCVALNGTSLSDSKLADLLQLGKKFIIWMDGDKPGKEAARKIKNKLGMLAHKVVRVESPLDPKCYSREQIEKFLRRSWSSRQEEVFKI